MRDIYCWSGDVQENGWTPRVCTDTHWLLKSSKCETGPLPEAGTYLPAATKDNEVLQGSPITSLAEAKSEALRIASTPK